MKNLKMSKKFYRIDGRGKQEGDVNKNIPVGVWPYPIVTLANVEGYLRAYYEENKATLVSELTQTSETGNRYSKMFGIDLTKYAIEYELPRSGVTGYYTQGGPTVTASRVLTDGYHYHLGCEPCKLWAVGWWFRENTAETDPMLRVLPTESYGGGLGPIKNIDGHLIDYYPYICAKHLNDLNTIISADTWEDEEGKASKNAHNLAQYFSSNIGGEYSIHYLPSDIYAPKNDQLAIQNSAIAGEQLCWIFTKNSDIWGYALCDQPTTVGVGQTFKRPQILTPTDYTYYHINDFNTYIIDILEGAKTCSMDVALTFGNTNFNTQTTNIKWRGFICIGGPRENLDEVARL